MRGRIGRDKEMEISEASGVTTTSRLADEENHGLFNG
jgi:hypothetical protein